MTTPSAPMAAAELEAAYRRLFAPGPMADVVLADLVAQGGVFASNLAAGDGGVVNAANFGIYEGARRLALRILELSGRDVPTPWTARANPLTRAAAAAPKPSINENAE